jgi:predicted permease
MIEGLARQTPAFRGLLAHAPATAHLTADGATEPVIGDLVTGAFFEVLGLRPAHGRLLTPDDDRAPSAHPVVVLGHGYFERRFGGDPAVVGRTLHINNHPMTVVGVAPRGFHGIEVGASVDVYVPLAMQQELQPTWGLRLSDWRSRFLTAMARLEDGVSLDQAQAAANVAYARLLHEDLAHIKGGSEAFKARFLKKTLTLRPGGRGTSGLRDQSRTPLLVVMGMVGLVLLIACANVASLLLARASSRYRETAVRLALGAGRARLVRQQLTESLLLSLAGGLLGFLLAHGLGEALVHALPADGAAQTLAAAPDLRVGLFTFALAVLAGVGFGLLPALRASRADLAPALKSEATALLGGGGFRLRRGLVVSQVALSLLLLVGAGLFTRSLMNLRHLDPGFRSERLYGFAVDPSRSGQDFAQRVATFQRILDELQGEVEVASVSAAAVPLMQDSESSSTVRVEGYEPKEGEDMNPSFNFVAPGFFETLGLPLRAGRDFAETDGTDAPRVAVVNETFARYFFKDQDAVGRRFGLGRRGEGFAVEIVGVVRDSKTASMRETPRRAVYVPFTQEDDNGALTFYVRPRVESAAFPARLRAAVARVDATLPVTQLKTMEVQIGESLFVERMVAALAAAFGLVATLLAALGLYGVVSHAVALRTREIGLRVALGADQRAVQGLVLRDVAVLVALGVALGLPGGLAFGRLVESQLFGVDARDPLTYAAATLTLVATAALAGLLPARRAARVDPMAALRC